MSQVDEGLIHAWLDGQLSAEDAARVERLVASDAEWAAAAGEARGLVAGASRILGALDHVPSAYGHEQPHRSALKRPKAARVSWSTPWVRAAAVIVTVAGISSVVWMRTPTDTMMPDTEAPMTAREQTRRPAEPSAAGAGAGQGAAPTGARAQENRAPLRGELAADRAFAAKAAPPAVQPAARRDSVTPRADDLARARAANEAVTGRVATRVPPGPLVEQGVIGAVTRVATDSASKVLRDGVIDTRLDGCWMQTDSTQLMSDIAGRPAVGQAAGRGVVGGGGGRGGRVAASGTAGGNVASADARAAQERDEAARRTIAVFRFIAPVATDVITALTPPTVPAAAALPLTARAPESSMAPLPILTNAQTRLLPDSSYVAEFIDARGRTELTFRVVGDTIRGRSRLTMNTVALPERMFVAVKTTCPR